jgi:hypothetical protein
MALRGEKEIVSQKKAKTKDAKQPWTLGQHHTNPSMPSKT